jgi:hypothetical protein
VDGLTGPDALAAGTDRDANLQRQYFEACGDGRLYSEFSE